MVADVEDFDVETDLPRFLNSVFEKAEYICYGNVESRIVEHSLLSIGRSGLVTLQNQRYENSKFKTSCREIFKVLSHVTMHLFITIRSQKLNLDYRFN